MRPLSRLRGFVVEQFNIRMTETHTPEIYSYSLIDSQFDFNNLGPRFRRSQDGPEEEFVRGFLANLKTTGRQDLQLTVFKEPRIESGSPDLVGVIWRPSIAEKWTPARLELGRYDIRLMHYFFDTGCSELSKVEKLFGPRAKQSVCKLEAADMVQLRGQRISPRPLKKMYAVKHIFAIEAKMNGWRAALKQAFLNRWFATSSYVLLSHVPSNSNVTTEAQSLGVDIWSSDNCVFNLNSHSAQSRPVSYTSWLFNEWSWRAWALPSPQDAKSEPSLDFLPIS
jgi:hypothetical protein